MSESNDNIGALSAEEIKKLIDRLCPPLYYGTSDAVSRGKVLHFKGDDFTPEFLTLHPDDVDEVRAKLQGTRRLVHMSKRPPEDFLPKRLLGQ